MLHAVVLLGGVPQQDVRVVVQRHRPPRLRQVVTALAAPVGADGAALAVQGAVRHLARRRIEIRIRVRRRRRDVVPEPDDESLPAQRRRYRPDVVGRDRLRLPREHLDLVVAEVVVARCRVLDAGRGGQAPVRPAGPRAQAANAGRLRDGRQRGGPGRHDAVVPVHDVLALRLHVRAPRRIRGQHRDVLPLCAMSGRRRAVAMVPWWGLPDGFQYG